MYSVIERYLARAGVKMEIREVHILINYSAVRSFYREFMMNAIVVNCNERLL